MPRSGQDTPVSEWLHCLLRARRLGAPSPCPGLPSFMSVKALRTHSLVCLFHKYLLTTCNEWRSMRDAGSRTVSQADTGPCPRGAAALEGGEADRRQSKHGKHSDGGRRRSEERGRGRGAGRGARSGNSQWKGRATHRQPWTAVAGLPCPQTPQAAVCGRDCGVGAGRGWSRQTRGGFWWLGPGLGAVGEARRGCAWGIGSHGDQDILFLAQF